MATKMTIHRALSELKLADAKITKQISEIIPVSYYQKDKLIFGRISHEDFSNSAKSKLQSILDLIKRKELIKAEIVKSNGITEVTVANHKMTVADAITRKSTLELYKILIERLRNLNNINNGAVNKNNESINEHLQRLLEITFGKENVKADPKDIEAIRKPFLEANEFHVIDPLKIEDVIKDLEKEVEDFESEIDAVLSEINAVTFIQI